MLTLKREAARIDWIQQDVSIVRHEGPPLNTHHSHRQPHLAADIEILHYLEEQGLWRHNITVRTARDILNGSDHTAKGTRLNHIVRWVKRYGNDPQNPGERAGTHTLSEVGTQGGTHEDEKGNAQVSEGTHEGHNSEEKKSGKGHIPPPL